MAHLQSVTGEGCDPVEYVVPGGIGDGLVISVAGEVGTDGASAGEADAVVSDTSISDMGVLMLLPQRHEMG